ncbi:MAG: HEAT repeat domain-containing protein [Pseudomonadota bacterium]
MAEDPLSRFISAVQPFVQRNAQNLFWEAEKPLRVLLASGHLQQAFNEELRRLLADPCYFSDWRPSEWVLHRGNGFSLAVSVFDAPRRFIHALPFHALYAPLVGESLAYQRYRLPAAYNNAVFDPGLALEPAGSEVVKSGEVLALHTAEYAYDFVLPKPVVVLKLSTAPIRPLEWLFQKETLKSWQANDADLSSTQLRVAADVLGKFAHQSSLEPLKLLTTHPHHAVRWTAIQNLGRLNRSEALAKLQIACSDPHPHIQRAAKKTLGQIAPRKAE